MAFIAGLLLNYFDEDVNFHYLELFLDAGICNKKIQFDKFFNNLNTIVK